MSMIDKAANDLCLECWHRRGFHDGAGCNAQLPNGDPCPCTTCVDMPSSEPCQMPHWIEREEVDG